MTKRRNTSLGVESSSCTMRDLESPGAIAAVDAILADVGLSHGTRATRADTWSGGERRAKKQRSAPLRRRAAAPEVLRGASLAGVPGLVHGFSTRTGGASRVYRAGMPDGGGDLNLGFTAHDDAGVVRANRRTFLQSVDPAGAFTHFALLQQRHTPVIRIVHETAQALPDFSSPGTMRGDGLLTNVPRVLLAVQAADCIPVLLCDPVRRAVGAFHAGWRGTLARIVERGVGTMQMLYGSKPEDMCAAIGPGIGPASYAVGDDVRHHFESQFDDASSLFTDVYDVDPVREKYPLLFLTARAPGHSPIGPQLHLDLWEANRRQLLKAGVPASHITLLGEDTAADTQRFFSYRAEAAFTGRMMSVIGLQPQ